MFPHCRAVSISTPVHSVTLGLPCRSVIAATLGASLVQSRLEDYANSIMYGMSASNIHKLQSAQNSLTSVVLPSVRHLSASERLSYSTGFVFTTEYSSKSLHLPITRWQPVISTISSNYTSHHELSVLQLSNYSKYHICLLILVGSPSATALLQHGIQFLLPPKIVRPYIVSSAT